MWGWLKRLFKKDTENKKSYFYESDGDEGLSQTRVLSAEEKLELEQMMKEDDESEGWTNM